MHLRSAALAAAICVLAGAAPAAAADPPLTVPKAKLDAALHCHGKLQGATAPADHARHRHRRHRRRGLRHRQGRLRRLRAPGLHGRTSRTSRPPTSRSRCSTSSTGSGRWSAAPGQPIAIIGISQGGLLPRFALTYWPSLREKVTDVLAAAGTQHGTTLFDRAACAASGCAPAVWQQAAGSKLLRRAERPARRDARPDRVDHRALDHRRGRPAADRPASDLGAEGRHEHRHPVGLPGPPGQPHRHRPRLGDLRRLHRRGRPQGRRARRPPAQGRLRPPVRARARRAGTNAILGASGAHHAAAGQPGAAGGGRAARCGPTSAAAD